MNNKEVKNIVISYWYKEMLDNPIRKVSELEDSLNTILKAPFMVNNLSLHENLLFPRIEGISSDKKEVMSMSLITTRISINVSDLAYDEIVLLINEKMQLYYDLLKEILNVSIIYTAVKVDFIDKTIDANKYIVDNLNLKNDDYEELFFKKCIKKDNSYYINYFISSNREVNYNIELNNGIKPNNNDLIDRTMIISLEDANIVSNFMLVTIEISDRLSFNNNRDYGTDKSSIRGMIMEIKRILNNELDDILKK